MIFAEGLLRLFSADGAVLPERFLSERPLVAIAATPQIVAAVVRRSTAPALSDLDINWPPRTVAELFEMAPDLYTLASRMTDQRVTDPADRQALVEFLARASR
ncbi:hypothetical protein [Roseicyclus sp.]|uniref:hypothetical protein n=1 Tax=Roseicyclus sp. TaxID=1914329 RepID=UPI003F6A2027